MKFPALRGWTWPSEDWS